MKKASTSSSILILLLVIVAVYLFYFYLSETFQSQFPENLPIITTNIATTTESATSSGQSFSP